jgi:hypothetical protein
MAAFVGRGPDSGRQPPASVPVSGGTRFECMGRLKGLVRHADPSGMADLSNLLGDVYGDPAPEPVPAPEPPAWAAESRLDEAFAVCTPVPLQSFVA